MHLCSSCIFCIKIYYLCVISPFAYSKCIHFLHSVILAFTEISLTSYIREICWIGKANHVAEQWGSISKQKIQPDKTQNTWKGKETRGGGDVRAEGGTGRGGWGYAVTWHFYCQDTLICCQQSVSDSRMSGRHSTRIRRSTKHKSNTEIQILSVEELTFNTPQSSPSCETPWPIHLKYVRDSSNAISSP